MVEDGEAPVRGRGVGDGADFCVAARVADDGHSAQDVEVLAPLLSLIVQVRRGCEAVDERALTAGAFGVREEVEHLQAAGIGEVGRVGVDGESKVGVGSVGRVRHRGEVPEATVLGMADMGDAVEEFFCCSRRGWRVWREGEAVAMLGRSADTVRREHEGESSCNLYRTHYLICPLFDPFI